MSSDFKVVGAEKFLRLSKSLKAAGELGMRRELNAALRLVTKPLIAETRAAARERLPKHGGLNESVAKAQQRIQVRTGAKTAGVRIVVSGAVKGADAGTIRHPVFGHRNRFVSQQVPGGWFDKTLEDSAPEVRGEIEAVLERVARQIRDGV